MNIVMICENQKFVLQEECPLEPLTNITCNVQKAYDAWIQANNKAHCYMLASMNDVLRLKNKRLETT